MWWSRTKTVGGLRQSKRSYSRATVEEGSREGGMKCGWNSRTVEQICGAIIVLGDRFGQRSVGRRRKRLKLIEGLSHGKRGFARHLG